METEADYYNAKFKEEILKHSVQRNDYNKAKHEWIRAGGYHPNKEEGNGQTSFNYYKTYFSSKFPQPDYELECICTHKIVHNCYIYNQYNKAAVVVGNCCIKRFLDNIHKSCEVCQQFHKRTKANVCNACEELGKNQVKFGKKHYRKTLYDVFQKDSQYLMWVHENVEKKHLNKPLRVYLERCIEPLKERKRLTAVDDAQCWF